MVIDIYEEIVKLKSTGEEGVLVTVVEKEGHGPTAVGTKMLVRPDGQRSGTVGGGALEYAAHKQAALHLKEKTSGLKKYLLSPEDEIIDEKTVKTGMICGGSITLFYEYIGSAARVFIFGAGHVGKALVYHLAKMDYYITLIDNREGMAAAVEGAQRRVTADYKTALENENVPAGCFFIIVSHSHALDYVILKRIYQTGWNPKYIGLIASRKKAPAMIAQLKQELGEDIGLDILYSPVGLDIGGQRPDEIAISIISEIQAIRFGKNGHRHMRRG